MEISLVQVLEVHLPNLHTHKYSYVTINYFT